MSESSDWSFFNPIKEQEVVQISEMSTNAKMAAEAASDGTEATEQNEEQLKLAMVSDKTITKTTSNSTELSKSEAFGSREKEMEVDQTSEMARNAKMAVEVASDETEAAEQEMEMDQTSEMASSAKMAAEVASEGTEATEQKIQHMQLAEDHHDMAMDELMEGTDDNEEQLKLATVSDKAITKTASNSTELSKNEASGSREKVSEEAPANAMDTKNIAVKEEPIEYEL